MNKLAYDLIKRFEGCRLDAYKDSVGIPTIGYGTTGPTIKLGLTWTIQQCEDALTLRVIELENQINKILVVKQNETQLAALISFAYNIGINAFRKSTMCDKINAGTYKFDEANIAEEFLRWNRAGDKVLPGLTKRRQAEQALYLS